MKTNILERNPKLISLAFRLLADSQFNVEMLDSKVRGLSSNKLFQYFVPMHHIDNSAKYGRSYNLHAMTDFRRVN